MSTGKAKTMAETQSRTFFYYSLNTVYYHISVDNVNESVCVLNNESLIKAIQQVYLNC